MLSELQNSKKIVGLKQVANSIENGTAKKVFLAKDVAPDIYDHILNLCKVNEIAIEFTDTRKLCFTKSTAGPAAISARGITPSSRMRSGADGTFLRLC